MERGCRHGVRPARQRGASAGPACTGRRRRPRGPTEAPSRAPILDVPVILEQLESIGVDVETLTPAPDGFERHLAAYRYPRFYAGGSVSTGGSKEAKLLEYYLSLVLLPIAPADVVIDVASERSVFPQMVGQTIGRESSART